MAVHAVPVPDVDSTQRQTRRGRARMLLVLAVCAAPVIASYFTYYVLRPQGRSNSGELILPTRAMPALELQRLDGTRVAAAALRGQWLLVSVGDAACEPACRKRLFMQRQLREMLGREKARVDKVWFVTGAQAVAAELNLPPATDPAAQVLRVERAALERWLGADSQVPIDEPLYLVDPMGELMMRFPPGLEPARIKRDLDRVLRASAGWDREGR